MLIYAAGLPREWGFVNYIINYVYKMDFPPQIKVDPFVNKVILRWRKKDISGCRQTGSVSFWKRSFYLYLMFPGIIWNTTKDQCLGISFSPLNLLWGFNLSHYHENQEEHGEKRILPRGGMAGETKSRSLPATYKWITH